jgi:hypothetical protein
MVTEGYTYSLALIHGSADPYEIDSPKYAWGFCIKRGCNRSSLEPFNEFIHSSRRYILNVSAYGEPAIEYLVPSDDLDEERKDRQTVFYVLIGFVGVSAVLGFLGIIVEYTRLGNVKLNHEETNFANIDIPLF